jgi:hypothetical protein
MSDYVKASPVAKSIPVDNTGISYKSENLQDLAAEIRERIVYTPANLTAIASTTSTLLESSPSLQLISGGMVTGYVVRLPDATTLFTGRRFEIANKSMSSIDIQDGSGVVLFTLVPDGIAILTLRTGGSSAGVWLQAVIFSVATGIQNINLNSGTSFITSSSVDVQITGFVVTPGPGTWAVWFSGDIIIGANNRIANCSIYKNNTQTSDSDRSTQGVSSNFRAQLQTLSVVNTNSIDTINVRVRINSGNLTVNGRSLLLIRLGV